MNAKNRKLLKAVTAKFDEAILEMGELIDELTNDAQIDRLTDMQERIAGLVDKLKQER